MSSQHHVPSLQGHTHTHTLHDVRTTLKDTGRANVPSGRGGGATNALPLPCHPPCAPSTLSTSDVSGAAQASSASMRWESDGGLRKEVNANQNVEATSTYGGDRAGGAYENTVALSFED